jgi:peptidoglycan hydrolase-like protein with peptidoglycan-binding domain
MKSVTKFFAPVVPVVLMVFCVFAQDYQPREDVIWARSLAGETIALDGILDEAAWSRAESLVVKYGEFDLMPTSASTGEGAGGPGEVTDPLDAVVKFLVSHENNEFYVALSVKDKSVLGSPRWGNWDGFLTSLRSRTADSYTVQMFPTANWEYFLTYWRPDIPADSIRPEPGDPPYFQGYFGGAERNNVDSLQWNAGITVDGISNDNLEDNGYVFEIRMALDSLGYDLNQVDGEVLEYNFSIYDCDYLYDDDPLKAYTTRTCWQNYWNNNQNVGRVYTRPDVTINSGVLPDVPPDFFIPNGAALTEPTIDGVLDEEVWDGAYTTRIKFGDADLRSSYEGVGKYRSGQWQPDLDGNGSTPLPQVLDPTEATVKIFFRDDYLYLAADVNDQLVQGTSIGDAKDGVRFVVGDRASAVAGDNRMEFRVLFASFGEGAKIDTLDYLAFLAADSVQGAEFSVALKGQTTVDDNTDVDEGYVIEMKVDLKALGYPAGLGDHLLFMGASVSDGDSFDDPANNYGTRTWWWFHHGGEGAAPWIVMDENLAVGVRSTAANIPSTVELYGNFPNPFNPSTTLRYAIPFTGKTTLKVYNIRGQEVQKVQFGLQAAGAHNFQFEPQELSSGLYLYQVEVENVSGGKILSSRTGKMLFIK